MEKSNRRNFLFAGLSLAALAATHRFFKKSNKEKKPKMRFLTQDGKLVEIDADKVPATKKAASKTDLQNWVTKTKPL